MLDHRKNIPSLRAVTMPERATAQKARESWHLWGIISEFVEATERLSEISPAVSIFGSARSTAECSDVPADRRNRPQAFGCGVCRHQRRRAGHHGGRQPRRL